MPEGAEAGAQAERARDALVQAILGGDIVHYDGQPGDATLEYRGITREGYDGWRVAGPVVSAIAARGPLGPASAPKGEED